METTQKIQNDTEERTYVTEQEAMSRVIEGIAACRSLKEMAKLLREAKKSVKPAAKKPRKQYTRRSVKYTLGENEIRLTFKAPEGNMLPEVESVKDGETSLLIQVQAKQADRSVRSEDATESSYIETGKEQKPCTAGQGCQQSPQNSFNMHKRWRL